MENENLEYVGFWPRVGATLIDSILILVITLPLLLMIYGEQYFASESFVQGPADVIISWILPAVAVIWFWSAMQATPGKMAVGAKIVDSRTGNIPSTGQWIGRYLAYFLSAIPLCLGYIWVAFDPKKQGWHDKLAGTVVVRLKNRQPQKVEFE